MVEAPFFDDESGDDADDELSPAEQIWYGTWDGETFLETTAYVFLTNFLATLISPTAAIAFLTIPRAFRVLIRQNPHGANLLLFLDGGLFKVINGYSPFDKIAEFLIVSPGTEMLLVQDSTHDPDATPNEDGNYVVDVIRTRLTSNDVLPPTIRYVEVDGAPVFQTTTNGTDWVDSPEADPRYNPQGMLPPLTPYEGLECDVAARMTAQLKATLDIFIATGDAAQFATGVLALLVFPFGLAGWFLDALLLVANVLIDIGQADIETAFTTAVYDDIQCILSCYINADGRITQAALDVAYDQIEEAHSGVVATTIAELRFFYGDVAMINAGVSRTETGDCSECDPCGWIIELDFTGGNTQGMRIFSDSSFVYGAYTGAEFRAVHTGTPQELLYYLLLPGAQINGISIFGTQFHGTGIGHTLNYYNLHNPTSPVFSDFELLASGGIPSVTDGWLLLISPAWTLDEGIGFYYVCDGNGTGNIDIKKMRIGGTGIAPTIGRRVDSLT